MLAKDTNSSFPYLKKQNTSFLTMLLQQPLLYPADVKQNSLRQMSKFALSNASPPSPVQLLPPLSQGAAPQDHQGPTQVSIQRQTLHPHSTWLSRNSANSDHLLLLNQLYIYCFLKGRE